jgi:hypothetical protein
MEVSGSFGPSLGMSSLNSDDASQSEESRGSPAKKASRASQAGTAGGRRRMLIQSFERVALAVDRANPLAMCSMMKRHPIGATPIASPCSGTCQRRIPEVSTCRSGPLGSRGTGIRHPMAS